MLGLIRGWLFSKLNCHELFKYHYFQLNKSMRAPVEQGKQFYGVVFNITAKGTASWDWYGPLFNNSQHREDWVYVD